MQALAGRGFVVREARRHGGPGRPELIYRLADAGEALFPRREGSVLRELAQYLIDTGRDDVLDAFVVGRVSARTGAALERVRGLSGPGRLAEVARIFSEEGYMAEIRSEESDGAPVLRLCHCPIRALVDVTDAPCRAEIAFAERLLGTPLARVEHVARGGASCSYAVATGDGFDQPGVVRR